MRSSRGGDVPLAIGGTDQAPVLNRLPLTRHLLQPSLTLHRRSLHGDPHRALLCAPLAHAGQIVQEEICLDQHLLRKLPGRAYADGLGSPAAGVDAAEHAEDEAGGLAGAVVRLGYEVLVERREDHGKRDSLDLAGTSEPHLVNRDDEDGTEADALLGPGEQVAGQVPGGIPQPRHGLAGPRAEALQQRIPAVAGWTLRWDSPWLR